MGVKYLFDTPVYWQLPKQFSGDKVSIKFKNQKSKFLLHFLIRYSHMVVT